MSGRLAEMKWNYFAADQPQFLAGDCVYIDPNGDKFEWRTASCQDHKHFVCDTGMCMCLAIVVVLM